MIRYIFALGIEGKSLSQISEMDFRTREKATHAFLVSGIPGFFVELINNALERDFCLHILNIFALIVHPFVSNDI